MTTGAAMERDAWAGKWHQIKGKVVQAWGELSGDEVDWINGRKEQLVGKLQEKYGYSREEAERQVDEFSRDL
jgi:uncharacterized protein YjbJ (UPF0337 family)